MLCSGGRGMLARQGFRPILLFLLVEKNFDDSENIFKVSLKWHRPFTKGKRAATTCVQLILVVS